MNGCIDRQIKEIPLKLLRISTIQPRRLFDEETLKELAASLKERGALQPIIVQPKGDEYDVIIGARRLKAAEIAGFLKIPAYTVKEITDSEILEMALTENMQREDLTYFEEAWAILKLIKDCGYTVKDICNKLKKSENFVRSRLTLLRLPEPIQRHISERRLAMETLVPLTKIISPEKQIKIADEIIKETLSVEQAKKMILSEVKKISREKATSASKREKAGKEMLGKKVFLEIKRVREMLDDLEFEKLSFPKRNNLKIELQKLKRQIEEIIGKIEALT